jgi:hypothetical protein
MLTVRALTAEDGPEDVAKLLTSIASQGQVVLARVMLTGRPRLMVFGVAPL